MDTLLVSLSRAELPLVRPFSVPKKSDIVEHAVGLSYHARRLKASGEQRNSFLLRGSMAGGSGTVGKLKASTNKARLASGRELGKPGSVSLKIGERARKGSGSSQPAWPALKKQHMLLQSRRELRGLDLFTVPGFLSPKECQSFIQAAETLGFQQQGSRGPNFGEAFRDNGRVSLQSPSLADKLWEAGLSSLFQDVTVEGSSAIGLNPNIRFYRYSVGQRFGQHIDESAEVGGGKATQYTLLIYLTGGENLNQDNDHRGQLVGGETVFYDRRRLVAEVPPAAGMALLHIHGEQCLLHEARVVTKGVKYVLRSDVIFNPILVL